MNIKIRLTVMNFLQFAVWGAYLTSMGTYLAGVGLGSHIGIFYAMQGIVSLFMPAILGIIADRWVPAQRLLGMSHLLAALFMGGAGYYAMEAGSEVAFGPLFLLYSLSVAFYMPTLGLSNSVAFTALEQAGLDTIKAFPPIRTFGTIGFICSMWLVDLLGFQANYMQFFTCAVWGLLLALYANTLPGCPVSKGGVSCSSSSGRWLSSSSSRCCWAFRSRLPTDSPTRSSRVSRPFRNTPIRSGYSMPTC